MDTRIWTPGRIVALLAIALAMGGLAHARFAGRAGAASVPDGAHAGQLKLHPCTYPTEAGKLPADCGTLVVPENRANPRSRLVALPVTRIRARSAHPAEPIFRLEGGPGVTNMDFPMASRYIGDHDLVLVGYRGVDGSQRLDCPEVASARRHTADLLSAGAIHASARALRECADRLAADGVDLTGYTIAQRTDDFEDARRALGYDRVDLLSESFGTRVALIYAWRHPQSIHRSVMVGVNPPGHFLWSGDQTEAQIDRFSALCRAQADCPARDFGASMRDVEAHFPKRWGPFPIHRGTVEASSFYGLMEASSDAAPISAPMTLGAWRAAQKGDASGLWFHSFVAPLVLTRINVWGDTASMGRVDYAAAAAHFRTERPSVLNDGGSRYLWADGELARAWPAAPDDDLYVHMRDSDVPTLLISGTLDGATPPENATRELLPHLSHGRQVRLDGFGHTIDFWNHQVAAGNHLINTYFDTGRVDASRFAAQKVDFTPSTTQTGLARTAAGAMVGLALFALISLEWMVWRVRARGRLGRVTRVLARSVWALLVGLGAWLGVALVTLVAAPSVPIDAELVLIAGMAVPVAAAVHCGTRRPDRAGLGLAPAGAAIGAWVGFTSGAMAMAIVTTLVGAVAGANLALIARDMVRDARRRRPVAAPPLEAGEPVLVA